MRNENVIFHFIGPFGVRVEVGQSLGMLLVFLVVLTGGDLINSAIFATMLVLAIFLHEMGHAWGSIVQGVPVRRVMLHGGGGFCESARSGSRDEQEFIVLMGPLVNLGLWALASLAQWAMWDTLTAPPSYLYFQIYSILGQFAFLNLALFVFNLLPVQPLDGGKLLHLTLLRFLTPSKAHRTTGAIGLIFSIIWIPAAIFVYVTVGWILFFIPSIPHHFRMAKGELG